MRGIQCRECWSTNSRPAKNCHLSRVLAIVAAGRSMGETDRSMNHQDSGPRGLKCCKIKALECCNFATFQSRLFGCSLARENTPKIARNAGMSKSCVTPQPRDPRSSERPGCAAPSKRAAFCAFKARKEQLCENLGRVPCFLRIKARKP